jgi:hypothetical protein
MMRRLLSLTLCIVVLTPLAFGSPIPKIKEIKIRGYVTAINSPTSFEIEDYRIT